MAMKRVGAGCIDTLYKGYRIYTFTTLSIMGTCKMRVLGSLNCGGIRCGAGVG